MSAETAERIPAECWPVGHFIETEMAARGWNRFDVAERMGDGDPATHALTIDLLVHCSGDPAVYLDVETAQRLGWAFDTSADLWLNLHNSYAKWRDAPRSANDEPNMPFERIPQHAADPGFGPVPPAPDPKVVSIGANIPEPH